MADLSDITAYLASAAASAVYPNGTSRPSVAGIDCRIFEGWPIPSQLDLDVGGKVLQGTPPVPVARTGGPCANVSVYPMPGAASEPYQILDNTEVVVAPGFGLSASIAGTVVTVSGTPSAGEYLTVIADGHAWSSGQALLVNMLADLATQAIADGFAATSTATTLTIPFNVSLVVRQGAPGTLGKVTHRQKHMIMVSVWAPDHTTRTALAAAIDNALKQRVIVTLSDSTQAKVVYSRANVSDELTTLMIYRRDLIFECEYATLQTFTGYIVTAVKTDIQGGNWAISDNNGGAAPPTINDPI